MVFSGELSTRAWSAYLTTEQAASGAKLHLGYQNAIVVAPEISRLTLSVNGVDVVDVPVESPDSVTEKSFDIPANLLRAGFNDIRVTVSQRNRTDCTIQSTYELWTEIKPESTYLEFADANAGAWRRVEDIRAIGTTPGAETRFNVVVPGSDQIVASTPLMRLASALGLMAEMPNQSFNVSKAEAPAAGPGQATIVMGTAEELRPLLPELPPEASAAPFSSVIATDRYGPSTLVISGPTWAIVGNAVESLASSFERPLDVPRATISTRTWSLPDPPLLLQQTHLRFSDLGVETTEFSGRRFRTGFTIAVPSDFFANAYGQATVLLDAAYTAEVLAGSHIDVYVNGNIAATLPITTNGGELLRHLPIPVTLRHFQPGYNRIELEAVLLTDTDRICAPGATGSTARRFGLFDTSEFVMPNFARIAELPNLSTLGGTAFPYGRSETPIPLLVDRTQIEALSSAATLVSRMSVAAGRPIPVDASITQGNLISQNALAVGVAAQIPGAVLREVGFSETSAAAWGQRGAPVAAGDAASQSTLDQWQDSVSGLSLRGQVNSIEQWLNRTFNVSLDTFRLLPGPDPEFSPAPGNNFVVIQQTNPSNTGVWTVFTAPTSRLLEDGMRSITTEATWRRLGGRATAYNGTTSAISVTQAQQPTLIQTQPPSFFNYRAIAANWLSANALAYAIALAIMSVLLGTATLILLNRLGRK